MKFTSDKARAAFLESQAFLELADSIGKSIAEKDGDCTMDVGKVVALMTNASFSAECALKCLLINQNIKIPKEHDLESLFLLLPSSEQEKIKSFVMESFPGEDPANFEISLSNSGKAFVQWRYWYENPEQVPQKTNYILLCELARYLQKLP
jgi:hypothetical protein